MNERIKDLARQACITIVPEPFDDASRAWNDTMEKFAELIVAECSRVIVNGGYWSGGLLGPKRQCTPPEIATMIKEHFGVEE